jgi:hypothetical protein
MRCRILLTAAALLTLPLFLFADGANFDLAGPAIRLRVTRGAQTLPIGEVPNLLPGDTLWIQPEFPAGQTARYLLIVSFLRGATNPPPVEWFTKTETWTENVRKNGVTVTVPQDAEQALLLLAPVTGGDFVTLRTAVRGKPGAFVRAVQDLQQATLQRSRLDKYLAEVQKIAAADPKELQKQAPLLAHSLKIKIDDECFGKPADQQAVCLTQNSGNLVLDDGNTQSMVSELASGANTDLIGQISATKLAGGGAYSPYFGAVVDVVRIFGNMHTAKYQYIPAVTVLDGERASLMLNNPPSFRDPKSVIVAGLPPIGASHPPILTAVEAEKVRCLQNPAFVLPLDGAPLLFSTGFAHDLRLVLRRVEPRNSAGTEKGGQPAQAMIPATGNKEAAVELAAAADANRGGVVLRDAKTLAGLPFPYGEARLKGKWGFEDFEGPTYLLTSSSSGSLWSQPHHSAEEVLANYVLAGENNTVHLLSLQAECVEKITRAGDSAKPLVWKPGKPGEIELQLPLDSAAPGSVTLQINEMGQKESGTTAVLPTYANELKIEALHYHAGERTLKVTGTHLEHIESIMIGGHPALREQSCTSGQKDCPPSVSLSGGVSFAPAATTPAGNAAAGGKASPSGGSAPAANELTLATTDEVSALAPAKEQEAWLVQKDGRVTALKLEIEVPLPNITLLNKQVHPAANEPAVRFRMGDANDLPVDGTLTFFLKSVTNFDRAIKIEIATTDEGSSTLLGFADGGLLLQDLHTARAELNPKKSFGPSAFGELRFRIVDGKGGKGEWQPLTRLVRLPKITRIVCPEEAGKPCRLEGNDLFLIDSLASDEKFSAPVTVPEGFTGNTLEVPAPNGALLYLKLRDAPGAIDRLLAPVFPGE